MNKLKKTRQDLNRPLLIKALELPHRYEGASRVILIFYE